MYDCGSFPLHYVTAEVVVCTPICQAVLPLWLLCIKADMLGEMTAAMMVGQPPTSAGVLIRLTSRLHLTVSVVRWGGRKFGDQDEGKLRF